MSKYLPVKKIMLKPLEPFTCLVCGLKFQPAGFNFHVVNFYRKSGYICLACITDGCKRKIMKDEGLTLPSFNDINEALNRAFDAQKTPETGGIAPEEKTKTDTKRGKHE